MSANGIKTEADIRVKPEPIGDVLMSDEGEDDLDEDTGELQFPKTDSTGWLMRIPPELWQTLDELKDDDPVKIGEIFVWTIKGQKPEEERQKVRLKLDSKKPKFARLPKEYDVEMSSGAPRSTFIFSEKDRADYNPLHKRRVQQDALKKTEGGRVEKFVRRGPRTIPKHTRFVTAPAHEAKCTPRETEEWRQLQAQEQQRLTRGPLKLLDALTTVDESNSTNFLHISQPTTQKRRAPENKYQRIDEGALLIMLQEKFKEYKFWPLKSLQAAVKQPESYLRETLLKIAVLVQKGNFANTWTLKRDMYAAVNMADLTEEELALEAEKQASNASAAALAPEVTVTDDDDDEMDYEDVEM